VFNVIISGHNGVFNLTHPALLTPFQAASVALRMAGTDRDTGYVTVLDPLDTPETFEFLRVDGTLAIV
jgi:hypothetical protein